MILLAIFETSALWNSENPNDTKIRLSKGNNQRNLQVPVKMCQAQSALPVQFCSVRQ